MVSVSEAGRTCEFLDIQKLLLSEKQDPGVGQTEEFSFSLCYPGEQWPLSSVPRIWHKVWYLVDA